MSEDLFSDYDDSAGEDDDTPSERPLRTAIGVPITREPSPPAEAATSRPDSPQDLPSVILQRIATSAAVRCAAVARLDGPEPSHLVVRSRRRR